MIWWSAAFPGFGHLLLSRYIEAVPFITLEIFLNVTGNLNAAMVYSFTGHLDKAAQVAGFHLILLYIPLYLFGIWDSYHKAVASNKVCLLAFRHHDPPAHSGKNRLHNHKIQKRNPRVVALWSFFFPGLGHFSMSRKISALILLILWTGLIYFSNLFTGMELILAGRIRQATTAFNLEWLMFMPSIYFFALYDAYRLAVEHNRRLDREQSQFLKSNYQHGDFEMPEP